MRAAAGMVVLIMAAVVAAGLLLGLLARPLVEPWLLAAGIFFVNYFLSLASFRLAVRLSATAAAALALAAFLARLAFIGASLVLIAIYLRDYFLASAFSFLVLYTVYLGLEIAFSYRRRRSGEAPAGEARP